MERREMSAAKIDLFSSSGTRESDLVSSDSDEMSLSTRISKLRRSMRLRTSTTEHVSVTPDVSVSLENFEEDEVQEEEEEKEEYEDVQRCFGLFKTKRRKTKKARSVSFLELFKFSTGVERLLILIGVLAGACQGVLAPMYTIVAGEIMGEFGDVQGFLTNPEAILERINDHALIFVYMGIGAAVAGILQVYLMMWTSQRQSRRMRKLFLRSLLSQDMGWYEEVDSAEVAQGAALDIHVVEDGIGDKVATAVQSVTMFIGGMLIGLIYSWQLTLVILAMAPLLVATSYLFAQTAGGAIVDGQTAYAKAGAVAYEAFSMIRVVASCGLEKTEAARYSDMLEGATRAGIRKSFWHALGSGLTNCTLICSYGLAFWYGSLLVRGGTILGQDVFIVIFAVIIGAMALGDGSQAINAINEARGAAPKVFEIISRKSEIDAFNQEGKAGAELLGNIEFIDVKFGYRSRSDALALKGLNLSIEAGSTVALVGESGSGKTTTMNLLERFYDPTDGSVLLDGIELDQFNVAWLRGQIGYVSQTPTLFAMSIKDNIALGGKVGVYTGEDGGLQVRQENVSMEEVIAAAKAANAHDFIMELPCGYDTIVGDRGAQLSGGQKQRIAIARALSRDPKILLFDEATSALDNTSERLVQKAMDNVREGRTVVVIAHRLSTIRNADKIVVFEDGMIRQQGTHEQLVANDTGIYSNLVKLQKSASESDAEQDDVGSAIDRQEYTAEESQGCGDSVCKPTTTATSTMDATTIEMDQDQEENEHVARKGALRRAMSLNKPEWPYFVIGIFCALIGGLLWPAWSLIMAEIGVLVLTTNDEGEVRFYTIMFAVLGFAMLFSHFLGLYVFGVAGERLMKRLRNMAFEVVIRQSVGFFDLRENSAGSLTSRLGPDVAKLRGAVGERQMHYVYMTSILVFSIIIAFSSCWSIALVVLACMPVMTLGPVIQVRLMRGLSAKLAQLLASANSIATSAVDCVQTVTALGAGEKFLNDYDSELELPAQIGKRKALINGLAYGFTQFCSYGIYAVTAWFMSKVIYWGWCDFLQGLRAGSALTFGAIAAGMSMTLLPEAAEAGSAAKRVFGLIDMKSAIDPMDEGGEIMEKCRGEVELNDVVFQYPARPEQTVLKGLSVKVGKGRTLALVGPSGAGKSTVAMLAERFYDPTAGEVKIDGKPLPAWNTASMRDHIGFVTQEPELFSTTVRENIAHGLRKAEGTVVTEDEIVEAAKLANAHEFVMKLPHGYDTQVGAHGAKLSGGQRQRIAIARAVVRKPPILLLDEATSAVDSKSERIVQSALSKAAVGRTTIVIAHRLSTVVNAETIAVVSEGRIVETGNHADLMSIPDGVYASLYKQQEL
ncbi:hypothetical protein NDN08_007376 [Rhodosorus marinus]|uniref:Probable ATP-dependent transporter ycf16 n=1 Tax=Rhodosorus marinus TaxID=101924 RepID=A0AAV8UJK9_9RHOD|nr:hypothetical protein NDN08_007376 [Rhodosorus marinus]